MLITERERSSVTLAAVQLIKPRRGSRLYELMMVATVTTSLALLTVFVSVNLAGRFDHRAEIIQQQFAILAGGPYPINGTPNDVGAYQNRVMFPLALQVGVELGVGSVGEWYLLLRLATACLAFSVLWLLLRQVAHAQPRLAIIGLGLLSYELIFTFSQGWEHPTDFPDVAVTCLWVWSTLTRQSRTTLALCVLAAFNRESAAFAGVLWIAVNGFSSAGKIQRRQIGFGVLLSAASYVAVLAIRWIFGGPNAVVNNTNVSDLLGTLPRFVETSRAFLTHPTPWSWPVLLVAMAVIPLGWIWTNRAWLRSRETRMLVAAAAIAILSLPFSSLDEPRDFMTSVVLVLFVAVAAEAGHSTRAQLDVSCN